MCVTSRHVQADEVCQCEHMKVDLERVHCSEQQILGFVVCKNKAYRGCCDAARLCWRSFVSGDSGLMSLLVFQTPASSTADTATHLTGVTM